MVGYRYLARASVAGCPGRRGGARHGELAGGAERLMRYFYDTEFIDDGHTIELISIGVAAQDGREYYAVSTEFDPQRAGSWVRTHVLPKLPPPASPLWRSRRQIRADLEDFFGVDGDEPIELWAWVGAYDHVVLCQLWGPMTGLPPAIPRFTHELRQLWEDRDSPRMPPRPADAHDALVDARDHLRRYRLMMSDAGTGNDVHGGAGIGEALA